MAKVYAAAPLLGEAATEPAVRELIGKSELTEFEVQRHYLHLSQMTLGMMGALRGLAKYVADAVDIAIMVFALSFFFWQAARQHDRDEGHRQDAQCRRPAVSCGWSRAPGRQVDRRGQAHVAAPSVTGAPAFFLRRPSRSHDSSEDRRRRWVSP